MKLNKEQQAMVEANMPLVGFVINKYLKSVNMDYEDMTSVGYIALCKAVEKYRPESGYQFSTYAAMAIVRCIQRDMLPMKRKKRGFGYVTLSFNQLMEDSEDRKVKESLLGYEPDFSDDVINRVLCEPLWKLCPTQCKLLTTGMNICELGKIEGVSSGKICSARRKEFENAREYLRQIGICDANAI